jgi:hypothetical protein
MQQQIGTTNPLAGETSNPWAIEAGLVGDSSADIVIANSAESVTTGT